MATTKKAAAAPKPLTPEQAVKQAVETVRAPYEAIREAQRRAREEADEEMLGSTGFAKPAQTGD